MKPARQWAGVIFCNAVSKIIPGFGACSHFTQMTSITVHTIWFVMVVQFPRGVITGSGKHVNAARTRGCNVRQLLFSESFCQGNASRRMRYHDNDLSWFVWKSLVEGIDGPLASIEKCRTWFCKSVSTYHVSTLKETKQRTLVCRLCGMASVMMEFGCNCKTEKKGKRPSFLASQ